MFHVEALQNGISEDAPGFGVAGKMWLPQ